MWGQIKKRNHPSCRHSAPLSLPPSSWLEDTVGVICLFPSNAGNIGSYAAKNMQLKIQGESDRLIFNFDKVEREGKIIFSGFCLGLRKVEDLRFYFK